ncbi:MAG: SusC/RagA family TonB-linked outer membrane protein [Bacteroidetes bacterium]|nr:SusC/RagA family TonB-linked outer membrane protein [Bacteroidota bacterium]
MIKLYLNACRYLSVLLLLMATTAFAQQTVTGKVTSADDGSVVPGANILEKGTGNGAVTDADGKFTISVGANATLVVSFVGYTTAEVAVGSQTTLNIVLNPDIQALSEVVVVGYGTTKSKDLTGSVAVVDNENFNKGVIQTPDQLFQGRTPGINVLPSSGEPGAASTITIRGSSSVRGNQDPLYIIDGVPLDNSNAMLSSQSGVEGSTTPKNPLLFLNPNDIESITVLKDASSAAIYGSRAANGVIIVTTKSGKGAGKKGSFSFSTYVGLSNPLKTYNLLNAQDFSKGVAKELVSVGVNADSAAAQVMRAPLYRGSSTDWQKQIYRTGGAVSKGYNLGWAMSNKGTMLRLSGAYDNQEGIVKNSNMERLTGRINFAQKFLDDRLKLDVSGTYANIKNSYVPNSNNAGYQGSLIGAAIIFNPTAPIHNPDGTFFDPGDGNRNPVEMLSYFTDNDVTKRLVSSVQLSYEIVKGLTAKGTFGYNFVNTERKSFADPRLSSNAFGGFTSVAGVNYPNTIQGNGRAVYQYLTNNSLLTEWTLNYTKKFGENTIDAVGGFAYQSFETYNHADVAWGQQMTDPLTHTMRPITYASDPFIKDINAFRYKGDAYIPSYTKYTLASYFARVNYNISEKYYFTGTVRADGSSKFGSNNKYGIFPAGAVKWKFLKEDFGSALTGLFSDFSLRANYGKMGSQDGLPPYAAVNLYQNYTPYGKITPQQIFVNQANNNLKWESATTLGVGLDWAIKSGRLSGTIDYFNTQRKDMIFYGPTPGGFGGGPNEWQNLSGVVINSGLEFNMKYEVIQRSKFNWNIAYNMTFYHNTLKQFNQPPLQTGAVSGQGLSGAYAQVIQNGQSLFSWNMPVYQGLDANGYAQYADGAANKIVGSALPKFGAGLTNNFSYGNWSLSVFVNSSTGFYTYNNTANAYFLAGSLKTAHNVSYSVYNSNENGINPGAVSTRFLEKGDFIRLSNVTLSHNFKVDGKYIKSLSLSLSGQNLYLWTKYTGLDPEVNVDKNMNGVPSRGFDYAGYPKPRTYTLGLNIGF